MFCSTFCAILYTRIQPKNIYMEEPSAVVMRHRMIWLASIRKEIILNSIFIWAWWDCINREYLIDQIYSLCMGQKTHGTKIWCGNINGSTISIPLLLPSSLPSYTFNLVKHCVYVCIRAQQWTSGDWIRYIWIMISFKCNKSDDWTEFHLSFVPCEW